MSSDDGVDLASFQKGGARKPAPPRRKKASVSPGMFFSDNSSGADEIAGHESFLYGGARSSGRKMVAVKVRPVRNRHEYTYYEPKDEATNILREYNRKGVIMYEVRLSNGKTRQISFDDLLSTYGGPKALQNFQQDHTASEDDSSSQGTAPNMRLRQRPRKAKEDGFVDINTIELSDDDGAVGSRKARQSRLHVLSGRNAESSRSRTLSRRSEAISLADTSEDSEESTKKRRRRRKSQPQVPSRRSGRARAPAQVYDDADEDDDEDEESDSDSEGLDILQSDVIGGRRKRKRRGRPANITERIPRVGVRQSDRATRAQINMQEANVDDIYRSDSEPKRSAQLKVVGVREVFETLPRSSLFRSRHVEGCEVCSEGPSVAPLIYCQACSLSYHKNCIGTRATRDHLVTKVGEDKYVLQCKRCINFYRKKDSIAPDLAVCQDCKRPGAACKPYKTRKTTQQEQRDRDENDGLDPMVDVHPSLINNASNVLFRCTKCSRAYHYHHLPPLSAYSMDVARDEEEKADERFQEYSRKWLCKDCGDTESQKVSGIIAWRPSDVEDYRPGTSCDALNEDEKSYLIKWEGQSYFRASWHSGAWTWGMTAAAMRKAFYKREGGPKMRTEDAIPEEFLRIDIVLDVKYTSYVEVRNEEIDKARIKEVDKALIKYKGLGYEDAVWEKVPTQEDGDRWLDFVSAYNDWVAGRYLRYPKQGPLKARIDKARGTAFSKLEKEKQPDTLVGGDLMKYQVEGLNWIYYQWYSQKNGILADEMGLGKTIQVIAFIATMVQEHNCFPFLVVVPNSTCANWRREIKQWVPSLRVVTFFGSSAARDMAYKYELYPHGTKEMRAHVVVTSYEAATEESARKILRGVNWAGLIVDEGQRLKNDKSQLYNALAAVKSPFRLLLTGTPLQNNARELFNLLQFLDDTINASELEEKYATMTSENIRELHDQIRPFILRRTKAQVLTFLPPLGQVIVPLSMSHLQRNLYKSILAKNPELLKTLFTTTKNVKAQERANLSNILMQLRKCLCHPFVYSREIEERTEVAAVSHRNLVEASAKLHLLELLLPKLQERGHRVLIFSQFLDMLSIIEDFLDGMQMTYQRLDGTMGSLEKQKRIDQFNAPDSPLFAFLLSTRAGGVGINLATADTVIILDPDFNPHQDIQAISRAHRIGQKKKVLCFQLMTRASAEERIVQIGRKKMALDHVVVEQMDAEDMEDKDVESILKHGAAELFQDDGGDHDIRYDEASIERLLDRSQIENTKTNGDDSAESQFSFARVWANDQGALEDTIHIPEEEAAPDPGVWDKILKERQAAAAAEALARADALGKGKRARMTVNYNTEQDGGPDAIASPVKPDKFEKKSRRKKGAHSGSDTDFQAFSEEESADEAIAGADTDTERLGDPGARKSSKTDPHNTVGSSSTFPAVGLSTSPNRHPPSQNMSGKPTVPKRSHVPLPPKPQSAPKVAAVKPFARAQMPIRSPLESAYGTHHIQFCPACRQQHPQGACPLKVAGVEHCGLCGLAHFGVGRTCPHIKSETQVREMLEALKSSPENKALVEAASKYLRGVKGHLVQQKKKDREKAAARAQGVNGPPVTYPHQGAPAPYQGNHTANIQPPVNDHHRYPLPTHGAPAREVFRQYSGLSQPVPSSVGSHLSSQRASGDRPHQRIDPGTGLPFDDHAVENALRGFLGR